MGNSRVLEKSNCILGCGGRSRVKIQMTENASHMTAAVQRVTLLLRAKNAEHFFQTKSAIQLFKTSICPLLIWLSEINYLYPNVVLSCWCEIRWRFNSTSDLTPNTLDLYRYIYTRYTYTSITTRYTFTTRYTSSSYSTGGHVSRSRGVTPGLSARYLSFPFYLSFALLLSFIFIRPPAPSYPSAASSGRRNSISISSGMNNMASMSSNTSSSMVATTSSISSSSRRRHVSMSSSYGTPAASRGLPFYWTWVSNTSKHLHAN